MIQKEFNLNRFLAAQQHSYETALREIRAGRKDTHWIWYIFPQLKGLGKSENSEYYGLSGFAEARAYFEDPILGTRLLEICSAVLSHTDKSAVEIFGGIDAQKLHSCVTLFREVAPDCDVFRQILIQFYNGKPDYRTLHMLENN